MSVGKSSKRSKSSNKNRKSFVVTFYVVKFADRTGKIVGVHRAGMTQAAADAFAETWNRSRSEKRAIVARLAMDLTELV